MLLREFIESGAAALSGLYPAPEARNIVLMLCSHSIGTKSYTHIVEPGYVIDEQALPGLQEALGRLRAGEPIQYVTGETEFCGLRFNVSPAVLIPRPETEMLVQQALEELKRFPAPARVLDLCTGSGCIAWSVALGAPGCRVRALDISDAALEVAATQPLEVEVESRGALAPEFARADVLDLAQACGEYDLILSNPPYIMDSEKAAMRPNVLEHEPSLALFVPDDDPLLFYRAVAGWSLRCLAPGGVGMVEINEALGPQTAAIYADAGFEDVRVLRDFYEKDRFVTFMKKAL